MPEQWITLSDATLRLGINRERLLRLIQGHVVSGRKNCTGQWEVSAGSISDYEAFRAREKAAPSAAGGNGD